MLFNNNFILASSSLSRYKILKKNKLSFIKIKPNCNEEIFKKKLLKEKNTPKKISLELARIKAQSVSKKRRKKLVVGCDTVISINGLLLNKARNMADAKRKIMKLSGRWHQIYSSVSVFYNDREIWSVSQGSKVKIRKLNERDIEQYLLAVGKKILSSVGCYQVEEMGPNIIEEIKGDFFNIMGFPIFPFLKFLNKDKTTQ